VFTLPLIKGDAATALLQPNTIVITEKMAQKYFGQADPLGKLLTFKDGITHFKVTGVIEKVPPNSHFHFDFFATMENVEDAKSNSFMTSGFYTYLVLDKGADYKKLHAKLPAFVNKYLGPQLEHAMGVTMTQLRQKGNDLGLYLQPLTDIHLHSDLTNDIEPGGDIHVINCVHQFHEFINRRCI
jgi:putative ABC transport system permease protein